MNKMILTLSILILLASGCVSNPKNNNLHVKVEIANKISPSEINEKEGEYYSININIINNTDSTVRFWALSCWWQDNFVFNANNVGLYYPKCSKNSETIKEVASGKSLTYTGILHIHNKKINIEKGFKLGLIFVRENEYKLYMDFDKILLDKKNRNKDIIWCDNPIFLDKM